MVYKAPDESKKEQMALVLRFLNTGGFIKEHFLDAIHVTNTSTLSLAILVDNNLNVQ